MNSYLGQSVSLLLRVLFSLQLHALFSSYWFAQNSKMALAIIMYILFELPVHSICFLVLLVGYQIEAEGLLKLC